MSTNLPPRSLPPEGEPSSPSPEEKKEQYSLDEMMKTLRDKEREKEAQGEVVTRADGSIARKVKRRRRRSEQPEKASPEKEKKRLLFKVVVAATFVLALFLTGLFLILMQNSKGHQEKLEKQASDWTGAKVDFKGLKRMPFSCSMQGASFEWEQGSFMRSLKLRKISGDVRFRNYLGVRPSGLQIGGMTGEMLVGTPQGKGWSGESLDAEEFPFDFDQYFCEALDISFGDGAPVAFKSAGVGLRFIGEEGYQVTMDQGIFEVDGWDDFPISNGLMRIKDGVLDVTSLALENPREEGISLGSDLEISGRVPFKKGGKAELEIETGDFPLEVLAGKRLALFFAGSTISSKGDISYTVGNDYLDEIKVDFTADSVRMNRLPFLTNLHLLFPDRELDLLEFGEGITGLPIKGTLRVRPEGVAIENLEMAQKGKVKLRGSLVIGKSGLIGGGFEIWINRFFLASQDRFKNSPLLPGTDETGFVKVNFKVNGTIEAPNDTFLEAIGVDFGSMRPAGEDAKKEDPWETLQKIDKVDQ